METEYILRQAYATSSARLESKGSYVREGTSGLLDLMVLFFKIPKSVLQHSPEMVVELLAKVCRDAG